jgi:hypothetical protein
MDGGGGGRAARKQIRIDRNFCAVLEFKYTGASEGMRHLKALRSEALGIGSSDLARIGP